MRGTARGPTDRQEPYDGTTVASGFAHRDMCDSVMQWLTLEGRYNFPRGSAVLSLGKMLAAFQHLIN